MTERNVRGYYFCPTHDRKEDWDFLAAWQPAVIRLMLHGSHTDPNSVSVDTIQRVHHTCPDALIVLRVWDVDDRRKPEEPGRDAHTAMANNPIAEADKQIDWWAKVFDRVTGVPRKQLMAGLNNETEPDKDAALYTYTERALQRATPLGVRLGVLVFSTGRPSLVGESPYDMAYFSRLEPLILANNGAAILHEYMQPEGMYAVWTDNEGRERKDYGHLIGRHKHWPMNVPIIIGEWGIEGILYNRHRDPVYGNAGWLNFKELWSPERYADEYVACVQDADENVIGTCPFIGDWADHRWQSADLLPAYEAFLKRKHLCVRDAATKPIDTRLPSVGTGAQVEQKPMNNAIIEPRVAQAILKIESGGRTHGDDGRIIIRFEAHIFKTYFGNDFVFHQHFGHDAHRPWVNQTFEGKPLHTGRQSDEYAAFEFAKSLNAEAAHMSISMGAPQIMGFNHARIGYPSAAAMFASFQDAQLQTIGFINFCLSDPDLAAAMRRKDWKEIARRYNGSGAINTYAPLLEQAYNQLGA